MNLPQTSRALRLVSAAVAGLLAFPFALSAATGVVTVSGSTWTGAVDGVTKYTGSSMAAAANACNSAMSSGWIQVKNSGNTNGQIGIKGGISVDGWGGTLTGSGTGGIVYAQNSTGVGGKNINMAGSAWYGMYFRTCQTMNFSGVNGTSNLAYRIDNCKGGSGSALAFGSPSSNTNGSTGSHFLETYGINGVSWSVVTASDRTDGCGLLLNQSSSANGTTVNATRCDNGGGYAGFRTANTNKSTTLGTVTANACGRGYFSVSNSEGATVNRVNATSCTSHGVWLQTTKNSKVNGGTITSCNPCSAISQDLGGNTVIVTCR